jgi:signal transduction histidine kinase
MNPGLANQLQKKTTHLVVGVLWIIVLGIIDYITGPEISLAAFYLPAIALVAWSCGRWQAVVLAIFAALVWLWSELATHFAFSNPLIPFWNAGVRSIYFLSTALLTAEVRTRKSVEAELRDQKDILTSILDSMGDGVLVVGSDGKVITSNPAAKRIFGKTALGANPVDWLRTVENSLHLTPSVSDEFQHAPVAPAKEPSHRHIEISLKQPNQNDLLRLALTSRPLLAKSRNRAGSVVVIADMTTQRELEKQISEVIEREQRRIGQDLHDGVCQHLVGVAFASGSLQADLEEMGLQKSADAAGEIATLINDAIGQARNLSHGLYPAGLEAGLEAALRAFASNIQERSAISCRFRQLGPDLKLDAMSAVHLYRIAQESVSNAIRHATSKNIIIALIHRKHDFELAISDDGTGMKDTSAPGSGIGHHIMQYRANILGGKLEISSTPNKGTRIRCNVPTISQPFHENDPLK